MNEYIIQINEMSVDFYLDNKLIKNIDINENPVKHFKNLNINNITLIHNIKNQNFYFIKNIPDSINKFEKFLWKNNQYQMFKEQYPMFNYLTLNDKLLIIYTLGYEGTHKTWIDYILENHNISKIYSSIVILFAMCNIFYKNKTKKWRLIEVEEKEKKIHFFQEDDTLILFRKIDYYKDTSFDDYITENSIEETFKYMSQEINYFSQDYIVENTQIINIKDEDIKKMANYFSINKNIIDEIVPQYITKAKSIQYFTKKFYINKFLNFLPKLTFSFLILLFIFLFFNIYQNFQAIKHLNERNTLKSQENTKIIKSFDMPIHLVDMCIKIQNETNKTGFDYKDLNNINKILLRIMPRKILLNNLKIEKTKEILHVTFSIKKIYGVKIPGEIEHNLYKNNIQYNFYSATEDVDNYNIVIQLKVEQ